MQFPRYWSGVIDCGGTFGARLGPTFMKKLSKLGGDFWLFEESMSYKEGSSELYYSKEELGKLVGQAERCVIAYRLWTFGDV